MIKQTQTKMFNFSDVGLDFCAGSKLLFPAVFKKILANGYNQKSGATVSITGNQVTLNFGVTHGYVADRVLKVNATGGYSKEVYIDSVTTQTVTFTESDTTNLNGTITTYIAPLGWSLLYESGAVQLYKMKNLAEQDVFVRFVFQTNTAYVNSVGVCIGMTADTTLGTITDTNTITTHATATTPQAGWQWLFGTSANATYNSYTYSQGLTVFGKGLIVGSIYHLAFLSNSSTNVNFWGTINAILPCSTMYSTLDKLKSQVVTFGYNVSSVSSSISNQPLTIAAAYVGSLEVKTKYNINNYLLPVASNNMGLASYYSSAIDSFNTTACSAIQITEASTSQHLGFVYGAYHAHYANTNQLDLSSNQNNPTITSDVDFTNYVPLCMTCVGSTLALSAYIAVPVEEIKLVS